MKTEIAGYKLRNRETGLFSDGSKYSAIYDTKNGKVWSTLTGLKNHLRHRKGNRYDGYEVVVLYRFVDARYISVEQLRKGLNP